MANLLIYLAKKIKNFPNMKNIKYLLLIGVWLILAWSMKAQSALNLDGTNDYVSLPSGIVSGFTDFSYETWFFNEGASNWQRLMDFGNGQNDYIMLTTRNFQTGTPRFSFAIGGTEIAVTAPNAIALNQWTHIALTFEDAANTATLYIDGLQVAQNTNMTHSLSALGSTTNNWLGRSQFSGDAYFDGHLDEVRIWNHVRSQTQIQSSMNCELTGSESGLQAYYQFNESSGTNLPDITANGNNGTLHNFALSGNTSNWVMPGGVPNGLTCPEAMITGNTVGCDTLHLTASGANTFLWSTGDTTALIVVNSSATYSVTVTDSGGNTDSASHTVTINNSPIVSVNGNVTTCDSTTLTATGGGTYLWNSGDTTAQITATSSGTYIVTVTSALGCTATDSLLITIIIPTNTYYLDADGDSYGTPDSVVFACSQPIGFVSTAGDCDDANASIHPGAPEICDDIDNNCNGILIEGDCPGNNGEVSDFCASVSSDKVLLGTGSFNYGSITNGLNAVIRVSGTVGQPLVGSAFEPNLNFSFGFWSRFLVAPSSPAVLGSEGEFPDRNQISWVPDPLSPETTVGFNIYRNGALLASVNPEVRSFIDFNVTAGEFYTYEVAGVNNFGEGYKGSALAFLNPNGVVTGKVETFSGNPVIGAVVTLTPTLGTALNFNNNASSFVEYDTLIPVEAFTVSSWVKVGDGNHKSAILDFGSHLEKNWWLHTQDSTLGKGVSFCIGRGNNDVTALNHTFTAGTEDEWHYIAASYNGSSLLLYVDGELVQTGVGSIVSDSSVLFLGQRSDGQNFYTGKMDEVRFFDRQLPQTEIQMLMNKTASPETEGLVSYWKFDEGIGSKAFNISENKFTAYHCGVEWTTDKPFVINAGITDESGFYKIEGINYSDGTTFTATPSKSFYLNQSLEFNGVNSTYANLTDFDLKDTSAITVTFKAFDFSGNQAILSKADAGGNNQMVLCLNAGNLDLDLNGQIHSFGSLGMGFHHIAINLLQDGSSLDAEVYKDGTLLGTHAFSGVATDWTGMPWKIGAKANGGSNHTNYFTGLIDEVVFFDTLLTLPEIQEYANIGTDVNNLFLTSIFNLNEGQDTIIGDMGPAFTGNGTIHGATWSTVTGNIETLPHEFIPGSRLVTLNPSNTGVDKIDFIDQSTIPVSGFVRFENTTCFQKRAEILVNGKSHAPQIFTDVDGKFVIDLEPGATVTLTPKFEDHTFFPAFWDLNNLSTPVAGILFQNQVKREVSGQLAGGYCRESIIPNSSIVKVKVATLNGCFEKTLDLEGDGKFTFTGIPPDSVTVAVIQHSNPIIYNYFQNLGAVTLDLRMENDTTDFIYFAPPEVELTALDTNACGDPMLNMLQNTKTTIKVFEQYDGGVCYLDTALITINNAN